jgi:hypothetical protein
MDGRIQQLFLVRRRAKRVPSAANPKPYRHKEHKDAQGKPRCFLVFVSLCVFVAVKKLRTMQTLKLLVAQKPCDAGSRCKSFERTGERRGNGESSVCRAGRVCRAPRDTPIGFSVDPAKRMRVQLSYGRTFVSASFAISC